MKPSKSSKRQWMFESLEPRNLLTGNVTVLDPATNDGMLQITGDNSANVLVLTPVGADMVKITGVGTKINGSSSPQTFFIGNTVLVDMRGGNDSLTIKNLNIQGSTNDLSLGVLLGDGNDALVLTGVTTRRACGIDGGSGNNAIAIKGCTFGFDLGIQTYDGVDALAITSTTVDGALSLQLGNGVNALSMVSDKVLQNDEPEPPPTGLPEGYEILEGAFFDIDCGAEITGGSSVDVITMVGVQIDCLTEIDTCSGVDSVAIVNSRFGNQPDVYDLQPDVKTDSDASGLCIETGQGSDAVSIVNTTVYGFLQIDTSGEVCCPCSQESKPEIQPDTPTQSTPVKDGNDAVALVKVNVYAAAEEGGWCCPMEEGQLLIYTGNQIDAVSLVSVCTDSKAKICTTDQEDSSLDGTDVVTIASSKFNQEDSCTRDTGLSIHTGNGNDVVSIAKTNVVGKAKIETGSGTDVVALAFLVADEICADLGAGSHDVLTVSNCTATDEVFSDEGTGGLLNYKHLNNHFINSPNISGFATIV